MLWEKSELEMQTGNAERKETKEIMIYIKNDLVMVETVEFSFMQMRSKPM